MSIFTKFKTGLAVTAAKMPDMKVLRKGAKAAVIVSSILAAGKMGRTLLKKVGENVEHAVDEGKKKALDEIRNAINKNLEKLILECVLRWRLYLGLILIAYITARVFNLRNDVLVALVILGIYSFYVIKLFRMCRWYASCLRQNGWMLNPIDIMKAYLRKAILDQVQLRIAGLSLSDRLAMNFFGPDNNKIANDLTEVSLQSGTLKREAITRLGMWACGWIVYALIYNKLFLLVTGIDFNAIWEPLIWPVQTLLKILSA